jgi:hypothetical protein
VSKRHTTSLSRKQEFVSLFVDGGWHKVTSEEAALLAEVLRAEGKDFLIFG